MSNPMGKPIGTNRARELAAMRKTYAGGRPLNPDLVRCMCGAMSVERALLRNHDCSAMPNQPPTELEVIEKASPVIAKALKLVLDTMPSQESKRKYKQALIEFLRWQMAKSISFNRESVHAWRSELEEQGLEPATINLKLSAVRKLASEASENGYLDERTAAGIAKVENVRQDGHKSGTWLTKKQTQDLILAPDPRTLKGLRDRAVLALLVGCGLRRSEAANLTFDHIQQREDRWVIIDMKGKRGRIRTIPVPNWVKKAIDLWAGVAEISEGRILRAMDARDRISHDSISGDAIFDIVVQYGRQIGVELGAHDLRRTCAKLCRKHGGQLEQIQMLLGHQSIQTTERYLGTEQDLVNAPNDGLGLEWSKE